MKIIFMGTPPLAAQVLESLLDQHQIVLAVTQPDKPKGRGQKINMSAVKELAIKKNIPIAQPINLKALNFNQLIESLQADLILVVAYRILPSSLFFLTKYGAINLHFSLLPLYRGAAPVQWALIQGEKKTGITLFILDQQIDHGRVLFQKEILIDIQDNTLNLWQKLVKLGIKALQEILPNFEIIKPFEQDHTQVTLAPKLTKEQGLINWNNLALTIHNQIRGMNPYPIAYSYLIDGTRIRILKSKVNFDIEISNSIPNGTLQISKNKELLVKCQENVLIILILQLDNKKAMDSQNFMNGYSHLIQLKFKTTA